VALHTVGVSRGDRFVIRAPNSFWYVMAVLGGMKAGAVPVLVSSDGAAGAVDAVVRRTGAKRQFATSELRALFDLALNDPGDPAVSALPADTGADDTAYVTCGLAAGGELRPVAYAHRVVIAAGEPIRYGLLQLTPDDLCLVPSELSGPFALDFSLILPLSTGAKATIYRGPADPKSVLAALETEQATVLVGTPDLYRGIAALEAGDGAAPGSLRLALALGEALPSGLRKELRRRFGLDVVALAARPETHVFAASPEGEAASDVIGLPLAGRDVELLTETGAPAAVGQVGRLCFPSGDPALAVGYEGMDADWRARHPDGWYYSDQLASRGEDGCLRSAGRIRGAA
jgi:acyl-coenzyme A synthetase/AMP-(fatty) acid ligase